METNAFLTLFEKSLVKNGFSEKSAHFHTVKVYKSLTPKDKAKIEAVKAPEEVGIFALAYARRVSASATAKMKESPYDVKADTMTISNNFRSSIETRDPEATVTLNISPEKQKAAKAPDATAPRRDGTKAYNRSSGAHVNESGAYDTYSDDKEEYVKVAVPGSGTKNTVSEKIRTGKETDEKYKTDFPADATSSDKTQKIDRVKLKALAKEPLTKAGKKEYTKRILIALLPASLGVACISVPVLIGYTAIALLIAFFIAVLVAVTVIGCTASLAGMIYGIVSLFSSTPEGIYEIGIALVILGVTLALAIASYNIAVRFVPILWRKYTAKVTKTLFLKLRRHLNSVRKECNKA